MYKNKSLAANEIQKENMTQVLQVEHLSPTAAVDAKKFVVGLQDNRFAAIRSAVPSQLPDSFVQSMAEELQFCTSAQKKAWQFQITNQVGSVQLLHMDALLNAAASCFEIIYNAFSATTAIPALTQAVPREKCTGRRYGFCGPKEYDRWTDYVARGITSSEIDLVTSTLQKAIQTDHRFLALK